MSSQNKIHTSALLVFFVLSFGFAQAQDSSLIDAARNQDTEQVSQLLADGADPNARQTDGATALHWAAYHENLDLADLLIKAGAAASAVNRLNASPLYLAVRGGNAELTKLLLDAGANPNVTLDMGETPIMTAARAGSAAAVQYLIDSGANVNVREESREQTALMWASAQGHVEVVRVLVEAGASLEARSKVRPMLMFAEATNGGAFDQGVMENLGGYSALLFAARHGQVEISNPVSYTHLTLPTILLV